MEYQEAFREYQEAFREYQGTFTEYQEAFMEMPRLVKPQEAFCGIPSSVSGI